MQALEIVFWYWWMLAVGFLAIELLAPGFFFLWLAVSSFIVGLLMLFVPMISLEIQLMLFSVLSVLTVLGWRQFAGHRKTAATDHPLLNQRGAQYIGRTFNLVTPIENGVGKIKVGDSIWSVRGPDCPLDSKVKVIGIQGTVFEVEILT
jgi:membrane protein implicated in regulation of membrane protease activity